MSKDFEVVTTRSGARAMRDCATGELMHPVVGPLVEAETLYEAAGIGLARLKEDGWIEGLGPGSRLEIQVREPSTVHSLSVQQLHRWVDGVTTSPAEVLRRARVKQLLGR